MPLFLNLETSTRNCSVSVSDGDKLLALVEESSDKYIHSEKLHLFIQKALKEAGCKFADLEAVAVGKGPGSYTGLRIGVSAAKGLCYSLQIPMLSFDGLAILVRSFLKNNRLSKADLIIPMLDARRMEVYCSVYNSHEERRGSVEAKVIDADSFRDLSAEKIHLVGDGAAKLRQVLTSDRFIFHDLTYPTAADMPGLSAQAFAEEQFEDVAYFEPFYLKDFVAGKPKKLL